MMSALVPFFYYLSAYSLGIAVLVTVAIGSRRGKDPSVAGFFYATLSMTLTVFSSTLQNYLRLPLESAVSEILSGFNYLTAAFFTVLIIRFFNGVYPWRGARMINVVTLAVTGVLTLMTAVNLVTPFAKLIPDLLLGVKNAAIVYTTILTISCRRRTERTRTIRFTRIIVPVVILCIPMMVITEQAVFKSFMLRFLPGVSLRGPWVLPGIYIVWCLAWLMTGVKKPGVGVITPSGEFCAAYGITPRERDVMILLVQGRSYRDIMEELFISLPTVKTHISNLYRKTGTVNRLELAVKAGMISGIAENHTNG
ncbi:MAG TPA: helix-turn-helix transcriptional regulator [Treponemataceae bacterium]|jgi:DNA-binding CsgD family transcriptional regulator|nr:MAG: Spore germination protein GerE [Spirochaetes bacterium ADurb.Bin215]HPA10991.1 helix-turn-helix transcriptional regulator [Treponemataceae bacterium]HPX12863.1 helix-turn-helix transcriptional regulator [Treponemataceae bacterium]